MAGEGYRSGSYGNEYAQKVGEITRSIAFCLAKINNLNVLSIYVEPHVEYKGKHNLMPGKILPTYNVAVRIGKNDYMSYTIRYNTKTNLYSVEKYQNFLDDLSKKTVEDVIKCIDPQYAGNAPAPAHAPVHAPAPAHAARNAPIDPIYKKLYDTLNEKIKGFKIVVKDAPGKEKDKIQIEINGKEYGQYGPYFYYDINTRKLTKQAGDLNPEHQTAFEESLEEVFGKHNGGRRRTHRKRKNNKRKTRR